MDINFSEINEFENIFVFNAQYHYGSLWFINGSFRCLLLPNFIMATKLNLFLLCNILTIFRFRSVFSREIKIIAKTR